MVSYDNDTYNLLFCLLSAISYRFKLGRVSGCYTQSHIVRYIFHNFWVNLMQERPNAGHVLFIELPLSDIRMGFLFVLEKINSLYSNSA